MGSLTNRTLNFLGFFLLVVCTSLSSVADDTEIYLGANLGRSSVNPNVLFIVDTSGSMDALVETQVPYDPDTNYGGCFSSNRVYWSADGEAPDECDSERWFDASKNVCQASVSPLQSSGFYQDRLAYWQDDDHQRWQRLSDDENNAYVECQQDEGLHGITAESGARYIADGDQGAWTSNEAQSLDWRSVGASYSLYSANFLNWQQQSSTTLRSRLDIVKEVVANVVDSSTNINVALMRFDHNGEGGMTSFAMQDVATARDAFKARLNEYQAGGVTPLSETLYEASLYFRGNAVDYGLNSYGNDWQLEPSVLSSRGADNAALYQSPIAFQCQKNFVILLTDGEPTSDISANEKIPALPGFFEATGKTSCSGRREDDDDDHDGDDDDDDDDDGDDDDDHGGDDDDDHDERKLQLRSSNSDEGKDGECLDELAQYLANSDQSSDFSGDQTVTTYTIGFQSEQELLQETADKGNGSYFTADDALGLTTAFSQIINEILAVNSSFVSPSLSVNAFSRTRHRKDLYFANFKPATAPHWDGNVKKYRLDFSTGSARIVDKNGEPAVDEQRSGFKERATSFWTPSSDAPDGGEVTLGGVLANLPSGRNVYTYSGFSDPDNEYLPSRLNRVHEDNLSNLETFLEMSANARNPTPAEVLQWARGDQTKVLGDPLHSSPAVVQYGGTQEEPEQVLFFSSNDGYLHAVEESSGRELFAFIPQALLKNLPLLYKNRQGQARPYGLDGSVVPWVLDQNHNGIIEPSLGDSVTIYVGMRRGGRNYYALDVTDTRSPTLKWVIKGGEGAFSELGQSWSQPVVGKIRWQNSDRQVLVFAGGYDPQQDRNRTQSPDSQGRAIYIVNAVTGERLWWAGPRGSGADLVLSAMSNSIPSKINAIDVNGNGLLETLFVGDTAGQVWRFDLDERDGSVAGGRIADLANQTVSGNRRFYHPPDLSLMMEPGKSPYLALLLGSGYRAHPLQTEVEDRIYMLRDYHVYTPPEEYQTITEAELFDTTDNVIVEGMLDQRLEAVRELADRSGWYIRLLSGLGSREGEKILAQPLIVSGVALITSYTPPNPDEVASCAPSGGGGSIYYLNVTNGAAGGALGSSGTLLTREDRKKDLHGWGIPPAVQMVLTSEGRTPLVGSEVVDDPGQEGFINTYWHERY